MSSSRMRVSRKKDLRPECRSMCPEDEVEMRIKNNLVHVLEKRVINSRLEYKMVKEYSRPAADKYIKSSDLRTIDALMNTAVYLIKEVYSREDVDYFTRYEFIFDRFRAIRQDLTIQRCNDEKCLQILEMILCFYLVSDYKLFSTKNYDEYINSQHLNEVLNFSMVNEKSKERRVYVLSAFVLLNLDNIYAITNILKHSKALKAQYPLDRCLQMSKSYLNRNFVKLFEIYKGLPLFCQLALHRKLPAIENEMMRVMSWAYSFKNVKYPLDNLLKVTTVRNKFALQRFVDAKMVSIEPESDSIVFSKTASSTVIKDERDYLDFIDDKLGTKPEVSFIMGDAFQTR